MPQKFKSHFHLHRRRVEKVAKSILLPTLLLVQSKRDPQAESLVIPHVTVIDVTDGQAKPDMTVVITGDRISEIGEASKISAPSGAKSVNAAGKFLIPGLWDMHVHWYIRDQLTLFTANGITGIREMFGTSDMLRWRQETARGSLVGPRM